MQRPSQPNINSIIERRDEWETQNARIPDFEEIKKESRELFSGRVKPRRPRSIIEFAENECYIPRGKSPFSDSYYSIETAPFNRFILEAYQDPKYETVAVAGPTQGGKTLVCLNIPILWNVFEKKEDVIVGCPDAGIGNGVWNDKTKVLIRNRDYHRLFPKTGTGARGGSRTDVFRFRNGVSLRFMGAGGGDAQKSSHTARNILITEADKMDDVRGVGEEADPVSQIIMRSDAYMKAGRKILIECTVTHEKGIIWVKVMDEGTGSKAAVPCPKCKRYQVLVPERIYYEGENRIDIQNTAGYSCESCEKIWNEEERMQALESPILLHKTQKINDKNEVEGEAPKTDVFGFHFNALYSPNTTINKLAVERWLELNTTNEDTKKGIMQSKWALPWVVDKQEEDELTTQYIRNRMKTSNLGLYDVPKWAKFCTMAIDVQAKWLYFVVDVWDYDFKSKTIFYGTEKYMGRSDDDFLATLEHMEDMGTKGFDYVDETGKERLIKCHRVGIDARHRSDMVFKHCKKYKRFWSPIIGTNSKRKIAISGKTLVDIPGFLQMRWNKDRACRHMVVNTSNLKALVHDRYMIEDEEQGGYTLIPNNLSVGFLRHITAEKREYDEEGNFNFVKVPGKNRHDWLDCRSYSTALAMYHMDQKKRKKKKKVASGVTGSMI